MECVIAGCKATATLRVRWRDKRIPVRFYCDACAKWMNVWEFFAHGHLVEEVTPC